MKIVLISCVAKKNNYPCKANEMYISTLFKSAYQYAKKLNPDKIFILSAKYGLLEENTVIDPYNETLKTKSGNDVRIWADKVYHELAVKTDVSNDQYIFLAGEEYRKHLVSKLKHVEIPLKGLRIGEQLKFYKEYSDV